MRRCLPFLIIFAIAIGLRLMALDTVPPGLQHDEVFHGHDAVTVLLGYHPLYFTSNAGNEPLFIYLMSVTIGLLGHNVWGIRIAAVICGLLTILFTYLWVRRAYNNRTALMASALMTVNFWPLFLSRAGLRATALPMMAALTAWLLVGNVDPGIRADRHSTFRMPQAALTGVALGLTLYTYPAARVLPVVIIIFFILCSLVTHQLQRPTLVALVVAVIVFAPLGYAIATQPEADLRLQQLGGPVQDLIQGNAEPVLRYTRDTLGMFTFSGDPIARYNLPGRPVFDPITGVLFYFGLLIAIKRWREPHHLFALIWLPIGLLPSMLSDSAPSFLRASAALPVTFLFPALAVDWLISKYHTDARTRKIILSVCVSAWLSLTAIVNLRDYFSVWPARLDVREVYRTDLALAAKWIDQQPIDQPIVIASTNPRDLDPFLFDFQLSGQHEIKWVDRAFGLVMPARSGKVISPAFSPLDPSLRQLIMSTFIPTGLASPPQTVTLADGTPAFEVFDVQPYPTFHYGPVLAAPGSSPSSADLGPAIELAGYDLAGGVKAGESLYLHLSWRVVQDAHGEQLPLSLFVHLLNARGEFAAGRDLLAFPTAGWRDGDWWHQLNDVPVPANTVAGVYQIEIGVYSQSDGSRWRVYDASGRDIGDRFILASIEIKP
jgi:4-amino-4-deoxy-L-arabinose transferase-like glycosyltransferase